MKTRALFFVTIFLSLITNQGISQISFQEYPLGEPAQRVTGIASADFDLDGDLDIITCLRTENEIIGYTNTGDEFPSFTTNTIADSIQGPFYICVSDLNQDGYQDIVVSLIGSNKIIALLNPGDLNQYWPIYIVAENFNEPHGVAIADINGDGLIDIIGTAAADNTIAFWQNNGGNPDTWTKTVVTDNFYYTQSIDVLDFDNDGDIDLLASANQANTIALWINDGNTNPNWEKVTVNSFFSVAHDAVFGDANGDNLTDIFGAACGSNQIACWLNTGSTPVSFNKIIIDNNFPCALTVRTGDVDMDGDLDAIACAWGISIVAWFENQMNTTGGWEKHIITESLYGAWPLCVIDLDGDNDIDILAGADKLNNPGTNGTFTLWENLLYTTRIEVNERLQKEYDIHYCSPGNELWVIPNKPAKGKYAVRIFDSLGRQLFSSYINISNGDKTVIKLPFTLGHTGIVHIIVFDANDIAAHKSLVIK